MTIKSFDAKVFSLADVIRLTGVSKPRIHGYAHRNLFRPLHYPRLGAPRGNTNVQNYCPRDVLQLSLLGAVIPWDSNRQRLGALLLALDAAIAAFATGGKRGHERLLFPSKSFAPWCRLSIDLAALVESQVMRMEGALSDAQV
ncbi:MAG: hypothetical protein ABSB88_07960 [Bryobacteraceae bacterium]|jgi:hypothetical protein